MIRRIFSLASLLSLLLCVATVVLWVGSYWEEFRIGTRWEKREVSICIVRGHVALEIWDRSFFPGRRGPFFSGYSVPVGLSFIESAISGPTNSHLWRYGRLGYYYAVESIPLHDWHWVVMPAWFVACLLATPFFFTFRSFAFSRRGSTGCCRCQYDLTGNTSGVCPECGTAVVRKAGA